MSRYLYHGVVGAIVLVLAGLILFAPSQLTAKPRRKTRRRRP